MIDEDTIPNIFYRLEYQTDIQVGTDEWECGNAYETYEPGAKGALIAHINEYPFLPVRIRHIELVPTFKTLGHYCP
jgi:hypothetical protein